MRLPASQIASLASSAGFAGNDLVTAVAVALAESRGGDPQAYNPELQAGAPAGHGSYGLWQVFLAAHPEFASWNLFDPVQNAEAAFTVWQSHGWRAWTTYRTGEYRKYLGVAMQALGFTSMPAQAPQAPQVPAPSFSLLPDFTTYTVTDGSSQNLSLYALGTVAVAGILIALFW